MSPSDAGTPEADGEARQRRLDTVRRQTKTWTGQLVDLTGRNNLLYYRDLKVGTLPLDDVSQGLLFDALVGRPVLLSKLFPDAEKREDAIKRARAVRNRANAHVEERGLETLYLACGMATWSGQQSAATPAAPVLLVPVRLAPKGAAQEEFELTVTGELEVNPTFLQMIKSEFEVDCDPAELLASAGIEGIIDTPEELEVSFAWLKEKCRSIPDFEVADRFVIGNYSYAKLPMVRDLEGSLEAMAEHELIAALAGDPEAQAAIREKGAATEIVSPDYIPPEDEFLVLDADSSQSYAINAVLGGRNLIVRGPPGTGKSQTIANLVSTLVARGKRVLFVAEKRAAIDAVLRRLDDVGLSDLVLDLHGGVSSRRQTAEALAKALATNASLGRPDTDQIHRALTQRREQLNEHVAALHEQRQPWQVSFFDAQTALIGLPDAANVGVRLDKDTLERLDASAIAAAEEDLYSYAGLGGLELKRSTSPWAKATVVSQEEAQDLQGRVEQLRRQLIHLVDGVGRAAAETGTREPQTLSDWAVRLELWHAVEEVLEKCQPEVFSLPLGELLEQAAPLSRSVAARASAGITSGHYRAAKRALREVLSDGVRCSSHELYELAKRANELAVDWAQIASAPDSTPRPPSNLSALAEEQQRLQAGLDELTERLAAARLDGPPGEVRTFLDRLLGDVATLGKLPELYRLRTGLERLGLGELLAALEERALAPEQARQALTFAWLTSLVDHLQPFDSRLGAFDGEQQRRLVHEFQEAERQHVHTTAQRVRRLCAEQAVKAQDAQPENAALIRAEAAKKRKHIPIRQLFSAAPDVMTALKPCWAMSPLVVSQVLPSDQPHFDVVVFDEASQIRPAEAMPAILRGKQLVVAGDERQLPPTDFFTASSRQVEDDDPGAFLAVDSGYESILEALAAFVDFRMLEWHYRSRDERLITFSNVYMYDRGLTTFPGIVGPECISHVHVPFVPGEPGSDVSAAAEVRQVVELILEHAEAHPDLSLGVIAMGIKHADRIDESLRLALRDRPDLEEFFDESRHEPFFVKNLERVQGDERDAIILSIGYGKNEDGRLLYRFGPLNQEGGDRRLNVAVTRAKHQMTLVSAFTHLDMDPDRSSARGVELLRAYLEYCASQGSNLGQGASSIPELNPFEVDVRDQLTRAGIPLTAQYGSSGYRIDFAAKHPTQPGRMVLAIECDGAAYHSSASARDRDRLRQEQLERIGWTFHRIWSQDWFRNKSEAIDKAKAAYDAAVEAADSDPNPNPATGDGAGLGLDNPGPSQSHPQPLTQARPRGSRPLVLKRSNIDDYRFTDLVALVQWIESDTLLRTKDQLMDEVISELGFKRRGKKIVAAVGRAIDYARRQSSPEHA